MATISDADMAEALEARRRAWRELGTSNVALSEMAPEARARADRTSAEFRRADDTLIRGLRQRRGSWVAPSGEILRLNRDDDGVLWQLDYSDPKTQRWHAGEIRRADALNARRFAAQQPAATQDGRRPQSTEDRA